VVNATVPPERWVDEVAVDRAVAGRQVGRPLSDAEIAAAARRLDRQGLSPDAIAKRLHVGAPRVLDVLGRV
jgi:hypothetical protein